MQVLVETYVYTHVYLRKCAYTSKSMPYMGRTTECTLPVFLQLYFSQWVIIPVTRALILS
jgi:hypothetical protein